jgi:hypothetical protein
MPPLSTSSSKRMATEVRGGILFVQTGFFAEFVPNSHPRPRWHGYRHVKLATSLNGREKHVRASFSDGCSFYYVFSPSKERRYRPDLHLLWVHWTMYLVLITYSEDACEGHRKESTRQIRMKQV